jgi:hypothetical protein
MHSCRWNRGSPWWVLPRNAPQDGWPRTAPASRPPDASVPESYFSSRGVQHRHCWPGGHRQHRLLSRLTRGRLRTYPGHSRAAPGPYGGTVRSARNGRHAALRSRWVTQACTDLSKYEEVGRLGFNDWTGPDTIPTPLALCRTAGPAEGSPRRSGLRSAVGPPNEELIKRSRRYPVLPNRWRSPTRRQIRYGRARSREGSAVRVGHQSTRTLHSRASSRSGTRRTATPSADQSSMSGSK